MRIAAISDVHGNIFALESVLNAITAEEVDVLVNLGDHLSGGVAPAETADLLLATPALSVKGNHERQILETPSDRMGMSDLLAHNTIGDNHRRWLTELPSRVDVAPGVLAFHGTPDNDMEYLLETVTPEGARPAEPEEVAERLRGYLSYDLLLCGHTHVQRAVKLADGPLVVNPGSVGYAAYDDDSPYWHAMEAGTPHARYAVVDNSSGQWEVEFRSLEYPWEEAAAAAHRNGRPDVEHALLTGRVLPRA